jgi:hypothetical protein
VEKQIAKKAKAGEALSYHMLSAFATVTIDKWDNFQTINYPYGHCILTGYMGLRPQDPDTKAYDKIMIKAYGQKRFEEIVGVNIHHVLVYPGLSVQSPLQQLRAVRPLGVDRTLTEIWHFRLKGAPEAIYRRSLAYYNLVNSPGDADQRRRPGEFLEVPPGPVLRRRRLGEPRAPPRPRHREAGEVSSAPNQGTSERDAQPDARPGRSTCRQHEGAARRRAVSVQAGGSCSIPSAGRTGSNLFTPDGNLLDAAGAGVQDLGRQPAIFAEDKNLMTVRMNRVLHPDAWSQRPLWETNHVVSKRS